jgi:hypothetical protein
MPRAASLITDFPNYYLSARLAHEGYDTSRMYEWDWLQREKDHRAIDIRVIGLAPSHRFRRWSCGRSPGLRHLPPSTFGY